MTDPTRRVWFHSTQGVCHGLPRLLGEEFSRRVLLVAQPGEKVILPPNVDAGEEVRLLNELGFGPRPGDTISSDAADLKNRIAGCNLYPFSATSSHSREVASLSGARFRGIANAGQAWQFNDKGFLQEAALEHGWRVPPGFVYQRSELGEGVIDFCRERFGTRKLVIKGTNSASGQEQLLVRDNDEWGDLDLRQLGDAEAVVVQKWIDHDIDASVQFSVNADGELKLLSDTTQLIEGGIHHVGNVFPAAVSEADRALMRLIAFRIITEYIACGLRDTVGGVDFVLRNGRELWACEVNARVVAPWYPWKAIQRRFGEVPPFTMRSFSLPRDTTPPQVASALGDAFYSRDKRVGCVPFCIVPNVPNSGTERGFCYTVTYGRTPEERDELFKTATGRLAALTSPVA